MNNKDRIQMKIPARAEYISVARLMVSGIASRMGFHYDDIEDIKIAVAEACTNAVDHAYPKEQGEVIIECEVCEDKIEFLIKDQGQGFDMERIQSRVGPIKKGQEIETLDEGGLGLYLMKSLMDTVKIRHQNGIMVKMSKFLQRDEVDAHEGQVRENEAHK